MTFEIIQDGFVKIEKAEITISADDKTKVYDGDESTDPELTATVTGVPKNGAAPVYSLSRAGGQDVDDYEISVSAPADDNPNYTITVEGGTFEITKRPVTVAITGNTGSKVFNGEEQSVEGYEVSFEDELFSEDDISFTGEAIAKGTDVGTYPMDLTAAQFTNNNPNFDVTFEVTDGSLEITQRYFTITYDLNGGVYDGSTDDIVFKVAEGTVITIHPAPTREGYTFTYWKGSEYQPGDKYTVTEDHTFTAQWESTAAPAKKADKKVEKTSKKVKSNKLPKTADNHMFLAGLAGLFACTSYVMLGICLITRRRRQD